MYHLKTLNGELFFLLFSPFFTFSIYSSNIVFIGVKYFSNFHSTIQYLSRCEYINESLMISS